VQVLVTHDDASKESRAVLDRMRAHDERFCVVQRTGPLGVGSAHKLALLYARRHRFDALVTMNGDGSHRPEDVPELVAALGDADFVVAVPQRRPSGPSLFGAVESIALGSDSQRASSLFRAYRRELIERIDVDALKSDDEAFAWESLGSLDRLSERRREIEVEMPAAHLGSLGALMRSRLARSGTSPEGARQVVRAADGVAAGSGICRICGGSYHVVFYAACESNSGGRPDVSPYSCASHSGHSHGTILRCLSCGIVFMKPKLSPEELVFQYSEVIDPVYLDNFPARIVTFQKTLSRIEPYIGRNSRILEVGSYCGAFLRVAREAGLDIVGLEPSAWAVQQSQRVTDAQVVRGTLDDLPAELGPFDAVAAWDVVEHFADPLAELCKVNRALVHGGRFVFCTLMIDNWFPRLAGQRWPWFMDMHLFYFTRRTIEELLSRAGFRLAESWPYLHITTPEYLLRKLGAMGLPGAGVASRLVSKTPWARAHLPVRLGDIQLFVAVKERDVVRPKAVTLGDERHEPEESMTVSRA